jgi:FtsH-binding integral membrane protein
MKGSLSWYRCVVWFGIGANLSFAGLALYAPARLLKLMGLRQDVTTVWLRNVGMLLVLVSMFNAGSALAPTRYPLFSWMVPIARLIAAAFFFEVYLTNAFNSTEKPRAFVPLGIFDLTMGIICSLLLRRGLAEERHATTGERRA